jgi:hypothetical protein
MIERHLKSIIVILLTGLIFFSVPVLCGQTPGPRQAEGIDLILMIDESGSMGGYGEHPKPNDPHNKRNELLHNLLRYIVESAYRGNVFRVSLVEFGSRTGSSARWRPKISLSTYKIQQPATGESRSDYLQRVSQELAHLRKDRTRGYSDHGAAFELALKEIKNMKSNAVIPPLGQSGTNHRLIVVFLITDGLPFVKDRDGRPIPAAQLKQEIRQKITGFPARDVILFAFGLNDVDKYWDELGFGTFWDLIASTTSDNNNNKGYAQFINDHTKILEQILPVLTRYTNPPGLEIIKGDSFDCPPYLKSVQFIVEFPRSYMKVPQCVEIFQPDKNPLNTANAAEMKVSATIDVPYPLGGVWRFKRKAPDVKLMVKMTYQRVSYVAPLSPVHMRSTQPIKFKASGPGPNNSFVLLTNFPLQSRVTIRTPNNTRDILNAELDSGQPGVFTSKTPYLFQDKGEYRTQFEASVISGAGSPLVVLKSAVEKIQVTGSTPLELVMEEPGSKVHSSFGTVKEEFLFGFYTDNGEKKVPLQDVLKPNQTFEAVLEVMDASDNLSIKKTNFQLTPGDNSLTGNVKMGLPLMEMIKILTGDRSANITVKLDQRHIKDTYFLVVPQNTSKLYEFNRKLGEGFLVYLLLVVGLLILAAAVVWLLYLFSKHECSKDVPVLVYRQESGLVEEDGFTRSIVVDKPRIHYNHGDIGFNVPESSEMWKPELTIKRHCVDEGVAVTVEYEKLGKTPADKKSILRAFMEILKIRKPDPDRERTRKVTMTTRFPQHPFIDRIKELKDTGMIFELRIQGKNNFYV